MNDVERYIELKALEDRITNELKEVKAERGALGDRLAGEMDREGIGSKIGQSGKRVSVTHSLIATVEDFRVFKEWAIESGQQDIYLKEVVNQTECSSLVREYSKQGILDQLPPGLSFIAKLGLRVTQPKNGANGFNMAAKSVIDMLKGGK